MENSISVTEDGSYIGELLAQLARRKGFSQGRIAEKMDVSRVSINRFFKGRSSIRTRDLLSLLKLLDIDLEQLIQERLTPHGPNKSDAIYGDVKAILEHLDDQARAHVIEQVLWWGKCVSNETTRAASDRLCSSLNPRSRAV